MSDFPQKIEVETKTNEGFTFQRRDDSILHDLVEEFNKLVDYLERQK